MATEHLVGPLGIDKIVCGSVGQNIANNALPEWASLAGLALFTSVMILLVLYVLSFIFRNDNLKMFAKFELYELVATLVLVVVLIGLMGGACSLKVGDLVPTSIPERAEMTIYKSAQNQFKLYGNMLDSWVSVMHVINVQLDQMASATFYSRPLGVGIVSSPLAGFSSPFKQITYNITVALVIAIIVNNAMLVVYEFAILAFLKYYLPIGIVMRCFTPTRRIGGTLIAIGLGFLFIFPLQIVLIGSMFFDPVYGTMPGFQETVQGYWSNVSCPDNPSETCGFEGVAAKSIGSFGLNGLLAFFEGLITGDLIGMVGDVASGTIGSIFTALFLLPLGIIARAFAIGYLMPAINTLILVQTVKHISKSIGEEIDISSLTRLV